MSGTELAIDGTGRPARAWLPDPLAARDLDLPVDARPRHRTRRGCGPAVADRLPSGWEPLARLLLRAEGVASSDIEGLRAPVSQIATAELDEAAVPATPRRLPTTSPSSRTPWSTRGSRNRLTKKDLHTWHTRLMRHSELPPHLIGRFRDAQGWIGGRGPQDAAYVPPPPDHVPALMNDLVAFTNGATPDPVTRAAVVHAQFETIHPYGDGNGRIGRLLVLWVLARRLDVAVPPPISVLIARDPGGYLTGLHWFRTGELARWVGWFASVVEHRQPPPPTGRASSTRSCTRGALPSPTYAPTPRRTPSSRSCPRTR